MLFAYKNKKYSGFLLLDVFSETRNFEVLEKFWQKEKGNILVKYTERKDWKSIREGLLQRRLKEEFKENTQL